LQKIAGVTSKGAILLGKNVVADGPADRPIRVVTHIHSDHIINLNYNIKRSVYIVATPTTLEMLEVLGYRIPKEKRLGLEYLKPIRIEDELLTLHRSRHIAGSAQVLVEAENYRVGYTGDFKLPGTPPLKDLDVLIIDATYGSPIKDRRWSEWEVVTALIKLIDEKIKEGPVWIYGFNGKLQEVMVELRLRGVKEVFVADKLTLKLMKIASKFYGVDIGRLVPLSEFVEEEPAVVFLRSSLFRDYRRRPGTHVRLTGREFRDVVVKVSDRVYNVSFSDHATFKEVIKYIEEARPKKVIVDAYRGEDARLTAKYINKKLGIDARAEP
jgi:putative mRNA 3-end processing factor